ncbi:hypothetical protein OSB04_001836 [Centaurea solstitialis]|uniref:RRM domain-containing protein n=1 Tax=Centaurea solstitialis TaxID=347529 RepID=A0AA38U3G2_9ASTR|nr:hypothetical protein OSB04_001836 [Centaurea solstitialis]
MRKIYVGNVPFEVLSKRLLSHFSSYGETEEGPLGFDKQSGKQKGLAFFVYKMEEGARNSLVDLMKNIDEHQVMCKMATDGKKWKGGGPQGGPTRMPGDGRAPPYGSMLGSMNTGYGMPVVLVMEIRDRRHLVVVVVAMGMVVVGMVVVADMAVVPRTCSASFEKPNPPLNHHHRCRFQSTTTTATASKPLPPNHHRRRRLQTTTTVTSNPHHHSYYLQTPTTTVTTFKPPPPPLLPSNHHHQTAIASKPPYHHHCHFKTPPPPSMPSTTTTTIVTTFKQPPPPLPNPHPHRHRYCL